MREVWFDTRLGEMLIGDAAYDARIEQTSPGDVVPLRDLVLDETLRGNSDYDKAPASEWTRDTLVALGSSMLDVLPSQDPEDPSAARVTLRVMHQLHILGIGPHPSSIFGEGKEFPTLQDFRDEIGDGAGYSRGKFTYWTLSDFVQHAARVEKAVGGKPSFEDFEEFAKNNPGTPTRDILWRMLRGGISQLNEHLGYANTKTWTKDEYVDFGVKFLEVNGEVLFKQGGILALAAKRRGPGYTSIIRKFDTWDSYKERVLREYHEVTATRERERADKLARYRAMIDRQELPAEFTAHPDDKLLFYAGRFLLAKKVAPSLAPSRMMTAVRAKPHTYLRHLTEGDVDEFITAGDIELQASIMGVYDDLWPVEYYKVYLKLTPQEVAAAIKHRNRARKRQ